MDLNDLHAAVATVLSPAGFFLAAPHRLRCEWGTSETIPWEVYGGVLVPPAQTRQERTFCSWNVYMDDVVVAGEEADPALISVKLDKMENRLHVTRSILTYVWEAYEEQPRVISTREARAWLPELVGSVRLERIATRDQLELQLRRWVTGAVYGTSRLPIISVESPLPQFSLGQFAYFPAADDDPGRGWLNDSRLLATERLSPAMVIEDQARLVETVLRATPPAAVIVLADTIWKRWTEIGGTAAEILSLLQVMFNQLALSPYTGFADNLAITLGHWSDRGPVEFETVVEALSYMLRHLVRHLTAYDLVEFHNRGANYPDALLLDLLLKNYLSLVRRQPASITADSDSHRLRRRALRQAWIMRGSLEGLPVPDEPTSPGENVRVLPAPHAHIPEHQLSDPRQRRLLLYADDPTTELLDDITRGMVERSIDELRLSSELRELGTAVFLDRPLGTARPSDERDRTPLVSYEAFSRQIAGQRLASMGESIGAAVDVDIHRLSAQLDTLPIRGIAVADVAGPARPGVVALADALRVAEDFVLLRTTTSSLRAMFAGYEIGPVHAAAPKTAAWLMQTHQALLVRRPGSLRELDLLDENLHRKILIQLSVGGGSPEYLDLPDGEVVIRGLRMTCDENGVPVTVVAEPRWATD